MFRKSSLLAFFILGTLLTGCEENEFSVDPVVITEQLLFVSGEQVRLSGRLVATGTQSVSDHGFILSTNESFSNPIIISLGSRTTPGRFIGETTGLSSGQLYFWKPFTIIDGNQLEGSPAQFTTLLAQITSFSPTLSTAGQFMFITGRNFNSDIKVFLDDREAVVINIDEESVIKIVIPPIGSSKFSVVKVVSQGNTLIAEQTFEYVVGKWEFLDNFITPYPYIQNVSFVENDTFYFGLGFEKSSPNSTLWSLDIPSWSWSETAYDKGLAISPFDADAFWGSGKVQLGRPAILGNQFIVLDNGNFIEKNPLPFKLYKSVGFKIGEDIYVLGGLKADDIPNYDVYKYISAEDRWEVTSILFVSITSEYPNFVHGSIAYFITPDQVMHAYDPMDGSLTEISMFPSLSVKSRNGVYEVIGDKAYIGLFNQDRSMWEYNFSTNSWKKKTGLTSGSFTETTTSFSHNGVIYVFKNPESNSSEGMKIWTFKPEEF